MIFSVFMYGLGDKAVETEFTYNGQEFIRTEDYWLTRVGNGNLKTHYHPLDVENINVSDEIINKLKNTQMFYTTFDPNQETLSFIDLVRFDIKPMLAMKNIFLVDGILENTSNYNLPIITCENTTAFVPVILFKESNQTKIYLENDCIIAESPYDLNQVRIKDRLLFAIFNII